MAKVCLCDLIHTAVDRGHFIIKGKTDYSVPLNVALISAHVQKTFGDAPYIENDDNFPCSVGFRKEGFTPPCGPEQLPENIIWHGAMKECFHLK